MRKQKLYHIRIQRWTNGYKEILVWPLTFKTYDEAFQYMRQCFTFKGLGDGKLSACIERC